MKRTYLSVAYGHLEVSGEYVQRSASHDSLHGEGSSRELSRDGQRRHLSEPEDTLGTVHASLSDFEVKPLAYWDSRLRVLGITGLRFISHLHGGDLPLLRLFLWV